MEKTTKKKIAHLNKTRKEENHLLIGREMLRLTLLATLFAIPIIALTTTAATTATTYTKSTL